MLSLVIFDLTEPILRKSKLFIHSTKKGHCVGKAAGAIALAALSPRNIAGREISISRHDFSLDNDFIDFFLVKGTSTQ